MSSTVDSIIGFSSYSKTSWRLELLMRRVVTSTAVGEMFLLSGALRSQWRSLPPKCQPERRRVNCRKTSEGDLLSAEGAGSFHLNTWVSVLVANGSLAVEVSPGFRSLSDWFHSLSPADAPRCQCSVLKMANNYTPRTPAKTHGRPRRSKGCPQRWVLRVGLSCVS